ncbi:MAG: SDR family oxidoreductase [Caldilineales bacterium]|nr:SDR family oxidoreductase [Caldilineales bacterium]
MIDISGKRILVTEIASPMGRSIARVITEAGASVIGAHAQTGAPAPTSSDIKAIAYDCRSPKAITDMVEQAARQAGRLDGAIIIPASRPRKAFLDQTPEDWSDGLSEIASHMFYAGQAVARKMVAKEWQGGIVYISTVATEMPFHEVSLFATNLAAINTIARVAALELGQYGITVNVVAPGWLRSDDGKRFWFAGAEFDSLPAEDIDFINTGVPLGRIGDMAELGQFCAFLLSDAAAYISGAYLPIDGAYAITKTAGNTPYPGGKKWLPFNSGYDPRTSDT